MKKLTFMGAFRDLIPMGYEFQKLFARNYRVYHKGGVNDRVWVWQKNRSVEYSGLSQRQSYLLAKMIIEGTLPEYEFCKEVGGGKYHRLTIDKETDGFCDYDERRKIIYQWLDDQGILPDVEALEKHEEAYLDYCKDWYARYTDFMVPDIFITLTKDLHDKKMIEV